MAHEMTAEDQMFSVREAPWHAAETNSVVLGAHPEPETVLFYAGLLWEVETEEVFRAPARPVVTDDDPLMALLGEVGGPAHTPLLIPGWKLLSRSDTRSVLNVAKDSYEVIQNRVGAELMDALLGEGNVRYETGGSVYGGATCYLTARIDEPVVIKGDDSPTFPFVVLTWTHDGSGALQARATNVRVVCWNTLSASEAEASRTGRRYTFRHTKNVGSRIEDAKAALAGVREEHGIFVELANELAAISVTDEQREDFVTTFIPAPATDVVISDRVLDNILAARRQVRSLFEGATIPEAHRNTAYGLVLAGTEYLDHLRGYRNENTYLGRTLLREESLKARLVPMVQKLVSA